MNNIHKVIFNRNTQQLAEVSELAKSAGKVKSVSADSVDIVSVLQNFSEKRPLVDGSLSTSGQIFVKNCIQLNEFVTRSDYDKHYKYTMEQKGVAIAGSDVSGQAGTHLKADGKVNIEAVDENHLERSKNKSSGFNVGVAIQFGNGISAGITAGGNVAKGYGNGDSQAWVASQVGDKNSRTTIESGGDTNIIGSQVQGKRVEVAAENLNIESLQDTAKYKGKQGSASAQVTVGYGASVGGSYNKSKVNSNYASVKKQAGIFAGDEGYDVDVNNKANPNQENSRPIKFGLGENDVHSTDFYAAAKLGTVNLLSNAKKSENASSITSSIISEGNFNIKEKFRSTFRSIIKI